MKAEKLNINVYELIRFLMSQSPENLMTLAEAEKLARVILAAPVLYDAVRRAETLERSNHGRTSHAECYQYALALADGREA